MQVNEFTSLDPNVDYTQILPIHQKRMIAFINHFVMNTVSFLNKFARSCESRLMEFEYKLQRVEASLIILESQLDSIPDLDNKAIREEVTISLPADLPVLPDEVDEPVQDLTTDPVYQRFFKMVQVGVPLPAVKLKMHAEGLDSSVLDSKAS